MTNFALQPQDPVTYLRSLPAVRERCAQVFDLAEQGKLDYMEWHGENEKDVVEYCKKIIERDFGTRYHEVRAANLPLLSVLANNSPPRPQIPPHGRRNHFITTSPTTIDRISLLFSLPHFPTSPHDRTKALLDLYVVSVLLDAGAGNVWTYEEVETGWKGGRSEGLAVASYAMFVKGYFSSDPDMPYQVDGKALLNLKPETMAKELQVTESNPMDGLAGRTSLLMKLGEALQSQSDIFAKGRPGDLLDFFAHMFPAEEQGHIHVPIHCLWGVLIPAFSSIWPTRLTLDGQSLGDVWRCEALSKHLDAKATERTEGDDLVPFHKLSQWLCYSMIQPIEEVAGWTISGWKEVMTGLAEYRNAGLLTDLKVIQLRPGVLGDEFHPNGKDMPPRLPADHPAIIEWRALTVIGLDRISNGLRQSLGIKNPHDLSLAQVLESATWKGGREIAKEKRGHLGGGPPIEIISDGTVF